MTIEKPKPTPVEGDLYVKPAPAETAPEAKESKIEGNDYGPIAPEAIVKGSAADTATIEKTRKRLDRIGAEAGERTRSTPNPEKNSEVRALEQNFERASGALNTAETELATLNEREEWARRNLTPNITASVGTGAAIFFGAEVAAGSFGLAAGTAGVIATGGIALGVVILPAAVFAGYKLLQRARAAKEKKVGNLALNQAQLQKKLEAARK